MNGFNVNEDLSSARIEFRRPETTLRARLLVFEDLGMERPPASGRPRGAGRRKPGWPEVRRETAGAERAATAPQEGVKKRR